MPGADLSAAPSLLRCPYFVLNIFTFVVDGEAISSAFSIHGIALLSVFRRQGGFFTPSTATVLETCWRSLRETEGKDSFVGSSLGN